MKYLITKKSIVRNIALSALVIMTPAYTQCSVAAPLLDSFSKFVYRVEKKVSSFFNQNDKTSYIIHHDSMHRDVSEYSITNESYLDTMTRSPHDALDTLSHEIAEYGRQMFSVILSVIKKYIGKPATLEQAKNFEKDLKAVFNPETAFKTIINKLEILKKKALAEGRSDLVTQITTIIKMIEIKRKEWNAKKDYELLIGLTTRMNCQ